LKSMFQVAGLCNSPCEMQLGFLIQLSGSDSDIKWEYREKLNSFQSLFFNVT